MILTQIPAENNLKTSKLQKTLKNNNGGQNAKINPVKTYGRYKLRYNLANLTYIFSP
jgi:hypothetical protein